MYSALTWATEDLQKMHETGIFKRILESKEHPKDIDTIFRRVDEARKNFEVGLSRWQIEVS